MIEVHNNLFVGDLSDCHNSQNLNVVHACKTPCHQNAVGYSRALPQNHPNYLIKEERNNLYLNLVDMNRILPQFTDEPLRKALNFIKMNLDNNNQVLVHCNVGQSRSCVIAMLFLARSEHITNNTFAEALVQFKEKYPAANLGIGFHNYLQNNWGRIMGDF